MPDTEHLRRYDEGLARYHAEHDPTPEERAQAVANCDMCDDNGYRGTTVCDHIDHTEINRRGIAKCRAVLAAKVRQQ